MLNLNNFTKAFFFFVINLLLTHEVEIWKKVGLQKSLKKIEQGKLKNIDAELCYFRLLTKIRLKKFYLQLFVYLNEFCAL